VTLRVLTWNVWGRHGDWQQRQAGLVRVLRECQADVVLLQEAWADIEGDCQPALLARALGGFHVAWGQGPWFKGRWLGNAVLSRWPQARAEVHPLPRLDGGPPYRQAVVAFVDTPWGEWPFASTHFEHRFDGSAARHLHAQTLLGLVAQWRTAPAEQLPVVIGADLNAVPDSDEVRLLTGRTTGSDGVVLSDVWEHVGPGGRFGGEGATWRGDNPHTVHSAWPNRRLDYVLVSWPRPRPRGNPVAAWLAGTEAVEGVHPSDHAAVVADLHTG
jgi:endonuclease/exonuclease/phosphatase family metal-dependent hydrolase